MAANGGAAPAVGELGVEVHVPPTSLCTDNAAMIASAARYARAAAYPEYLALDAYATRRNAALSARGVRDRAPDERSPRSPSTPRPNATCARTRWRCCARSGRSSDSSWPRSTSPPTSELHRAYFERIPVMLLDGEELCEYFVQESLVRERLESRR